jgi:DNA polymerase-3 subunit epsilon
MLRSRLFGRSAGAQTFPLDEADFAVIDLETTGLFPTAHDRVIEVGIVRVDASGAVVGEYATLINPARDLGPTAIHGIRAHELRDAPRFGEVAGDIASRLDGAVVVAHNARFERSFLDHEFRRCGMPAPDYPSLCTLDLAGRYRLGARRLADCCNLLGIEHRKEHAALEDARATASLLAALLGQARTAGVASLAELRCAPLPGERWPAITPSGLARRRSMIPPVRTSESFVGTLVRRLPRDDVVPTSDAVAAYLDVLDRALEDRVVTPTEAEQLVELARSWGIDESELEGIHAGYLRSLVQVALADRVLTSGEEADLRDVAELLGLDERLDQMQNETKEPPAVPDSPRTRVDELRGQTVCFTGQLTSTISGKPITRDDAQALARAAGLEIRTSVTKGLDLLVVADPDSMSGKARKARDYGTRIIAERSFWQSIGAPVD